VETTDTQSDDDSTEEGNESDCRRHHVRDSKRSQQDSKTQRVPHLEM